VIVLLGLTGKARKYVLYQPSKSDAQLADLVYVIDDSDVKITLTDNFDKDNFGT